MVIFIVLLTVVIFVLVDLALRLALAKRHETKLLKERSEALEVALRLEFADEAPSLKRVELEDPQARILAVDDEPVILDSFRRILVLEGFAVDTVETAQEALSLLRDNDYDFLYTDLKMPGMDGVELTRAARHLRPDIDVVVITGYATIETAVETMRHGAMDYVEKPFTAEELADFSSKLLIRRQDRLERQTPPRVHLVTPAAGADPSPTIVNMPGGVFLSPEHISVTLEPNGEAIVGLDDFILKTLSPVDEVRLPQTGARIKKGDPLFTLEGGDKRLTFPSPLTGRVTQINGELTFHLELRERMPLSKGWVCRVEPEDLSADLAALRIGAAAVPWLEEEVRCHVEAVRAGLASAPTLRTEGTEKLRTAARQAASWTAFEERHLRATRAA